MHTLTITYAGPQRSPLELEVSRLEDKIWSLEYGADIQESEYDDEERAAQQRAEAGQLRVELAKLRGDAPVA